MIELMTKLNLLVNKCINCILKPQNVQPIVNLLFISTSRQSDKNKTGVVPATELRQAIDKVIGTKMSDVQFDELMRHLSQSAGGTPTVDYNTFMEIFNSESVHVTYFHIQ